MVKEIQLTQGKVALVDDGDFEWLNQYKWCANRIRNDNYWYAMRGIRIKGKHIKILMHRFILGAKSGELVDHVNHLSLDNRRVNLRLCSNAENLANMRPRKYSKSSKFKGVTWCKRQKKWVAQLTVNMKHFYLGSFSSETDAAIAYNEAAPEYFGEFAHLNVI